MSNLILLVEDEENLLILLKGHLKEGLSFDIETANNGQEGLRQLKLKKYTMVISDHRMPEMTGAEMVKRLRSTPGINQHTPVIFLSGYCHEIKRDMDKEKFSDVYYLDKVRYPELLISHIQEVLQKTRPSF